MIARVKNLYFTGSLGGVTFRQGAGGAWARVTPEQAATIRKAHPSVVIEVEEGDVSTPVVASLRDIKGLGKKRDEKLQAAGIETPAALVEADADELAEKTGLKQVDIEAWQSLAADLISS